MNFLHICAVFLIIYIYGDVAQSTRLGQITDKSHPMLSSLFRVANNIQQFNGNTVGHAGAGQIFPKHTDGIGKLPNGHGIKKAGDIFKFVTQAVPLKNNGIDFILNPSVGRAFPQNLQEQPITGPGSLNGIEIKSGSGGTPHSLKPLVILSADRRAFPTSSVLGEVGTEQGTSFGDQAASSIVSNFQPALSDSVVNTIPVLPDSFDFNSQIDRHDLLQLTNPQLPQGQDIHNTIATTSSQANTNTVEESIAPIWMLSDSARLTERLPSVPLWSLSDNLNLDQATFADQATPLVVGESLTGAHGTNTEQLNGHEIVFVDGNLSQLLPDATGSAGAVGGDASIPMDLPASIGKINQPLDISTDFLRQLIILEASPSAPPGNAPVDVQESRGQGQTLQNGIDQMSDVVPVDVIGSVNIIPHIPRASDVFSNVRNEQNTENTHTLVLKDHGIGEILGVHVGSGPIANDNIRPLDSIGQNARLHSTNDQTANAHTLSGRTNGHSHGSSHEHHSPIGDSNTEQGIHIVGTKNGQVTMTNPLNDGSNVHASSTTTSVPTIEPARRVALQNWSKELLQGMTS